MKILQILGATKEQRAEKETARIGRQLKRNQEALIDELEAEKDRLEGELHRLQNVTVDTIKQETWNKEYHGILVDLRVAEQELLIAKEMQIEFFTDGKEESN